MSPISFLRSIFRKEKGAENSKQAGLKNAKSTPKSPAPVRPIAAAVKAPRDSASGQATGKRL